jgi:hypothetical protein
MEQVQVAVEPVPEQTPLSQLQLAGEFAGISGVRQIPVPVMPSSHFAQPEGHGEHCGPKNPDAQFSQLDPVKPVGQTQVPAVEQTAEEEQAGVQLADKRDTT